MKLTDMGLVQTTVRELLALRLKHFFSAVDADVSSMPYERRCGTLTTVSGFTEWQGCSAFPISLGWDWQIITIDRSVIWVRGEMPRANIQLYCDGGFALSPDDNLTVLASWIDAQAWQRDVARAVSVFSD